MKLGRRRFLSSTLSASAASLLAARNAFARLAMPLFGTPAESTELPPFSQFHDIALQAGLTTPIVYGGINWDTYIVEWMGGGCAFFDYDNDGWMGLFRIGGRGLESGRESSGNRL